MPTFSHNSIRLPRSETQTQINIAAPALQQKGRLPNPRTCHRPKAPAIGKVPFPPQLAKAPHAPAFSPCALAPAHEPAPAPVRNPHELRASAAPRAESAAPLALPSSPHSTLQIDPAAAAGFPPPATSDHPRAAAHHTP